MGELDNAFEYFTSEGIEDIVVDLRYNGGGSLMSAFHLSAQLGGNAIAGKYFSNNTFIMKIELMRVVQFLLLSTM